MPLPVVSAPALRAVRSLACAAALAACACSASPEEEFAARCPELGTTVVHRLLGNPEARDAWLRTLDAPALRLLLERLDVHVREDTRYEDFETAVETVLEPALAIASVLADQFEDRLVLGRWQRIAEIGAEEVWGYKVWWRDRGPGPALPGSIERLDWLREGMDVAREHREWGTLCTLQGEVARWYRVNGDLDGAYEQTLIGAARAHQYGVPTLESQFLGEAGFFHTGGELPESTRVYWGRALDVARRSDVPTQVARIHSLLAQRQMAAGRFAAAQEQLEQTWNAYATSSAPWEAFRQINEIATLYGVLGSWRAVERLVPDARLRRQQMPRAGTSAYASRASYEAFLVTRAALLIELGRPQEALPLLEDALGFLRRTGRAVHLAWGLLHLARAHLALGAIDEARTAARDARGVCEQNAFESQAARLAVVEAEIELAAGNLGAAAEAVAAADRRLGPWNGGTRDSRARLDVLAIDVALRLGDPELLNAATRRALENLERALDSVDSSPHAHLYLDRQFRPLRERLHALTDRPDTGYSLELVWRSLSHQPDPPGGGADRNASGPATATPLERWLDSSSVRSPRLRDGDVHVLYFLGDTSVFRWTRTSTGLRRETLPTERAELLHSVGRVTAALGSDAEADLPASLQELGRLLLPPEVRAARRLLVSPDGFLGELPFAALALEPGEPPLGDRIIVSVLRSSVERRRRPATRSVVAVAPLYPEALRRRVPELVALQGSLEEAQLVLARSPDALGLIGRNATRANLLKVWEGAGRIWLAGHVIRNPEAPFVSWFPMADSGTDDSAGWGVDASDLLHADLSACDLAVVSGCASGALYVDALAYAPGLGSFFLDAGARAVVHARWRIDDVRAREFARRLLSALETSPDIDEAFTAARREERASWPEDYAWAAWELEITTAHP